MKIETAYELNQSELDQVVGGIIPAIGLGVAVVGVSIAAFNTGMSVGDRLAAKYKK